MSVQCAETRSVATCTSVMPAMSCVLHVGLVYSHARFVGKMLLHCGKGSKKIWIYPYLDGWVVQDGDNIHKKKQKKHAFKIHHYRNPPPLQHPSLPTNTTHYCQPPTPTANTHHNKPPLMPFTTSIHHP